MHLAQARLEDALRVPAELRLQQLRVLVVLPVEPLEGRPLLRALHRRGQQLAVHLHQVHHRLRVRLALGPVQREHAVAALARAQRHHHARVARRQIQHAVERIAIAVRVVLLGEGPRPPRLHRLAQRGKVRQLQRVRRTRALASGPRAARATSRPSFEQEQRRQVEGRDPRQPVQPAAEQLPHRVVRGCQLDQVPEHPARLDSPDISCGMLSRLIAVHRIAVAKPPRFRCCTDPVAPTRGASFRDATGITELQLAWRLLIWHHQSLGTSTRAPQPPKESNHMLTVGDKLSRVQAARPP